MNPVITFNKTYEERLEEYNEVFRTISSSTVSASELQKKWSSYLQLNIESSGWLAIWKIPRSTCEMLNVEFPVTVVVQVQNVDFIKLTSAVKTLAVDDFLLSNKHFIVSLIELWPMTQGNRLFNINAISNAMDMLRVFYIYLFMPWDLEEDSTVDWLTEHLETRLTLFYDMRSENFPMHKRVYINELLTEARHLHARQKQIGNLKHPEFLNIKVSMAHIKSEIEILENPLLRNAVFRKEQLTMPKQQNTVSVSLVLPVENYISQYTSFLKEVKACVDTENVQFKSCLDTALDGASANETILLTKSTHMLGNICSLQEGGSLKGLFAKEDTVITSIKEDVMLDLWGAITFENLTIDISAAQFGILVRRGIVTLKNCRLICSFESKFQNGVIVNQGGILNVIKCDIYGFDTAIVVRAGGTLNLIDSTIADVNVGIRIYEDSFVTMESTKFLRCEECGIDLITDAILEENQSGSFDLLKMYSVVLKNVIGEENEVDCNITPLKENLAQDLLNYQSDSSSDEMDTTISNLYS